MIILMAIFTCLTGYGLGIGLATSMIVVAQYRQPNQLCCHDHRLESGTGPEYGGDDRWDIEFYRESHGPSKMSHSTSS